MHSLLSLWNRFSPREPDPDPELPKIETGQLSHEGQKGTIYSIVFSPDGKSVVSGSSEKTVCIWDVDNLSPIGGLLRGHTSAVTSVSYSPLGDTIASGSWDGTVRLWNPNTGCQIGQALAMKGIDADINSIAFSPSGKLVASGSDERIVQLWDLHTMNPVADPFKGHSYLVSSVVFTPPEITPKYLTSIRRRIRPDSERFRTDRQGLCTRRRVIVCGGADLTAQGLIPTTTTDTIYIVPFILPHIMEYSAEKYALAKDKAKKTKRGVQSILGLDREPCHCKRCRGKKTFPPKVRRQHAALHGLMTPDPPNPKPQPHVHVSIDENWGRHELIVPPPAPPSPIPLRSPSSARSISPMVIDSPPPPPSRPSGLPTSPSSRSARSRPIGSFSPLNSVDLNLPANAPSPASNLALAYTPPPRDALQPPLPRLSAARPPSFFMQTLSPIPSDPEVDLNVPDLLPDDIAEHMYPTFWSPPAFASPPSVGSQFTPGSQRSRLSTSPIRSPPPPPPSRSSSPAPPSRNLTPPMRSPSPIPHTYSSQHSRSSSADSGLSEQPIRFADPADDEEFYRDLLNHRNIAQPPPPQHNRPHPFMDSDAGYYESSDSGEEDNPGDNPPDANGPVVNGPDVRVGNANDPEPAEYLDEPEEPDEETFAAFSEPSRLRNIYIRSYVPSVFAGATKKDTHSTLENIRLALEDAADAGELPEDIQNALPKMARTIRSLRHRLGVDTESLLQVYTLCTSCGKRYSSDFIENTNTPNCPNLIGDESCDTILFTETTLYNGKRSRRPIKSYPYLPISLAIERLLSRPGMKELMQLWREQGVDDQGAREPSTRQDWLDGMPEDALFGNISEAWGWRSQHARMTREYDHAEGRYHDLEPDDGPCSLVSLPYGLSLAINFDGFEAHKHKKYEVQGLYITINNLPSYLRTLIENMMLVLVIPGPNQPTAYELDQILEPLVDDLLRLEQGVHMRVYDQNTQRMVPETIHARLTLGILDYIARLKITGHAGVASEDHFCLYCNKMLCQLSVREGYQDLELRNPSTHLQHKYEWLQAQGDLYEQDRLRKEHGTTFTQLDRLPGWYAPTCCPIDGMHQFDLGMTKRLVKDIILKPGLLHHRRRQPMDERPLTRVDDFIKRTYFPSHCTRLPPKLSEMSGRVKAEQLRNLAHILPVALFEGLRVGDVIPDMDLPRGGVNTKIYEAQEKMADHLFKARRRVQALEDEDDLDELRQDDCWSSRNPRDYYKVILCYLVSRSILFNRQHSRQDVEFAQQLLWRVNTSLVDMNVPLPPTAHLIMHVEDHILKFGSLYGTSTNAFERANKVLININNNGRGNGCLETTMARGFLDRADFFRLVRRMQAIENPTRDDTATLEVMLRAVRDAPEHETQRGMLDEVLAEHIRFPSVSAKVNWDNEPHQRYHQLVFDYCAVRFNGYPLFTHGRPPPNGVHFCRKKSTTSYSHLYHRGFRFGSDLHYHGKSSRYGFIRDGPDGRIPVLIKMIYKVQLTTPDDRVDHDIICVVIQRFEAPDHRLSFAWHHWQSWLGIEPWKYQVLCEPEVIPPTDFLGVFALSDIAMGGVQYWMTFSMDHTEPERPVNRV